VAALLTKSQPLRRHGLAVEATMRALARRAGAAEPEVETWGLAGLLHAFDYERYPTEADHVLRGTEILRERGWPEPIVRAIAGHALNTGVPRDTPMARALLAADELTGFVGACALVRPSKKVGELPPESVVKRMKDKAFARSVDRDVIRLGAEELGVPLLELAALVIAAQVPIAARLGLDGAPAADLPDEPVPPPPGAPTQT
jgi:putative nucleotidyltransferase with HDIG domain